VATPSATAPATAPPAANPTKAGLYRKVDGAATKGAGFDC